MLISLGAYKKVGKHVVLDAPVVVFILFVCAPRAKQCNVVEPDSAEAEALNSVVNSFFVRHAD